MPPEPATPDRWIIDRSDDASIGGAVYSTGFADLLYDHPDVGSTAAQAARSVASIDGVKHVEVDT